MSVIIKFTKKYNHLFMHTKVIVYYKLKYISFLKLFEMLQIVDTNFNIFIALEIH